MGSRISGDYHWQRQISTMSRELAKPLSSRNYSGSRGSGAVFLFVATPPRLGQRLLMSQSSGIDISGTLHSVFGRRQLLLLLPRQTAESANRGLSSDVIVIHGRDESRLVLVELKVFVCR